MGRTLLFEAEEHISGGGAFSGNHLQAFKVTDGKRPKEKTSSREKS